MTFPAVDVDQATSLFITYCKARGLAPRTLETNPSQLRSPFRHSATTLPLKAREGLLTSSITGWGVYLYGPPPGTELVYQYGRALMVEGPGGELEWKPGGIS
ncbi:MAG: hypothetical protein WCQ45_06350 [bacterium]